MSQEDEMARATAVQQKYTDELMKKPNVVGVAVGLTKKDNLYTNRVGLVVLVRKKVPESQLAPEDVIPRQLDGVPVDVQEVGDIRAY